MTEPAYLSDEQGAELVTTARRTVTEFLEGNQKRRKEGKFYSQFGFHAGVFVTLNRNGSLRGCIGYPLPSMRLCDGLAEAAVSAATRDPRFSPVTSDELDTITFEVTVLTAPARIVAGDPEEYVREVTVGRHGLLVESAFSSGLLLPQVPAEYGWDAREFLAHTCIKAGLGRDAWKDRSTRVSRFEGTIFREESPGGRIIREPPGGGGGARE